MRDVRVVLEEGAVLPYHASEGAAAFDLCASRDTVIYSQSFGSVPTGVRMELNDYAGIITHRSGHNAKRGIQIYGLIDGDYRGELIISVHNEGRETFHIKKGEAIAQLRIVEIPKINLIQVEEIDGTERGEGRHGSTDAHDGGLRDSRNRS